MKRILKFNLPPYGEVAIGTATVPTILAVGTDGEDYPCVWVEAEVGTGHQTKFIVVYTGDTVPDPEHYRHVGSFKQIDLILHVYQWFAYL